MRVCPACGFDRCDDTAPRCRQCGANLPAPKEERSHHNLASAWFHYLTIPQVGTVELTPGQAFSIGRGARCDLRLTTIRSERLASIFWSEDQSEATLERHPDANPKEPVEVNDVRVHGVRRLKGNEELRIGPARITYLKRARKILDAVQRKRGRIGHDPSRAVVRGDPGDVLLEPRSRRLSQPARAKVPPAKKQAPAPSPLERALRLEREQMTGVLRVTSPRGRGWVSVVSGTPSKALFNQLRGEAAVAAILQQQRGADCEFARGGVEPQGGEPVKVSFSTVQKKIERHRQKTTRSLPKPRPATKAMPKPTTPPKPKPRSWGDAAR